MPLTTALLTFFAFSGLGRALHQRPSTVQGPNLKDELLDRFIVVPEHNLLFCYMEKNACTNFNDLFRFLRSRYDPEQLEGIKWFKNTPEVHGFTKEMLEGILVNSTWHKAVFYREPMERFAAAYASKCTGVDKTIVQDHCKIQFGKTQMPFPETVKQIQEFDAQGDENDSSFDPHWQRQVNFCGGLSDTLQYYDTVEELDRNTANEKVGKILEAVGVEPKSVPHFEELFPPPDDDSWRTEQHNTGISDELADYFPSDAPWLKEVLLTHYRPDYDTFGMNTPSWAQQTSNLRSVARSTSEGHWPLIDLA